MILAVVSLTKEETDAARQYAVVAHESCRRRRVLLLFYQEGSPVTVKVLNS